MGKSLRVVGYCLLAAVVVTVVTVFFAANNLMLTKVFSPQFEQVRHDTFKQSQAYNDGMAQELQNMQIEYVKADKEHKEMLASIILHRAAACNEEYLPVDLRMFIRDLKKEKGLK